MKSIICSLGAALLAIFVVGHAFAADIPILEGLVEPSEIVDFSSHVPGIIEELNVERGDQVKKGQILAKLESGIEKAAVNLAQARVEFGLRKAQRNEDLYKRQLISVHEKDEIETEILLARLELAEAEEHLKIRTIHSTIDGIVIERLGTAGEYVGEEPFLTVARIDPLYVEVVVPVEYMGKIKKGGYARVNLEEQLGKSYRAKIIIVDRIMDAASGTFGVRLELPNPRLRLPAGLKCSVDF